MATSKDHERPMLSFRASTVAAAHTYLAFSAFLTALVLGCLLHFKRIVKNDVAAYPEEWFPSVSATIGDWYPERNVFQTLIALTAGPRFALVFLQYYLTRLQHPTLAKTVLVSGLVRSVSCGGWVYITSSDDHDVHDFFMITYIVCNVPWMVGCMICTPAAHESSRRRRELACGVFFGSLFPLVYFFIQHKVHRIPGAYSKYAIFEWCLIFCDVLYDSIAEIDFRQANLELAVGSGLRVGSGETIKQQEPVVSKEISAALASPELGRDTAPTTQDQEVTTPRTSLWATFMTLSASIDRRLVAFVADAYLSYVFWSIYTALAPTLFYFSIWELGIAGHELALLSCLSPALLGVPGMLSWTQSGDGRTTLQSLSLVGLAVYVVDSPLVRLLGVALANIAGCVGQAAIWAGKTSEEAEYQGIITAFGLILSSLSKHANHSNNPIWPFVNEVSGGYNKTGILLAILALCESHTRPVGLRHAPLEHRGTKHVAPVAPQPSWLPAAIAGGSLLFSLHSLLADTRTLISWSWTGYPVTGPLPSLHAALTLLAQCAGLLVPLVLSAAGQDMDLVLHPAWLACGATGAYMLYGRADWASFGGGLGIAVFLMSVVPAVMGRLAQAARGREGKTYFTVFLVVCLFDLASVWTVAYAFVPGGVYLRERTDLVLAAQILGLSCVFDAWLPGMVKRSSQGKSSIHTSTRLYTGAALVLCALLAVLATLFQLPSEPPRPFRPASRILRAGIWTVHFGIDNVGRDSQRGMARLIHDMELDVVGLLETDLHRVVYGNRDLTRVIAEKEGFYVDIGPGPNKHTWGCVLLSKFPIINSTHHLLPSPDGELAPAIEAVLDVWGTPITVVVAHNGQEETPLDRELQSKELARIMSESPRPVIFLGYVVTQPHAERPAPYQIMVEDGRVHDIDDEDADRWCEYIFYRGLYRTSYARLSRGSITDTELQVGQFVVPMHGSLPINDTREARYLRSFKEQLPAEHWFPMEYYGNEQEGGVNGHFYHVFNTPLYYKIPEDGVV